MTNKMQRYTIFFIAVNALHVSGGFSTHHQELKIQNYTHSIWHVCSFEFGSPDGGRRTRPKHVEH
jgi:hypothetical protein